MLIHAYFDEMKQIINRLMKRKPLKPEFVMYEYCSRCDANLTLQKGYDNSLPYWICKGYGEMLINPTIDSDTAKK